MRRIRKLYTSRVLPLVYDYSLSVTEMVGKLIRAVNDMADDVTDNTDDIETLQSDVTNLQDQTQMALNGVENLGNRLENVEEELENVPTDERIGELQNAINQNSADIVVLDSRVDILESQPDLSSEVHNNTANITTLQNAVASKSEVSYNEIITSGSQIGTITIDGVATDLYAPSASVIPPASGITYDNTTSGLQATDVQAAIDEVEGDVSSLQTAVASKSEVSYNEIITSGSQIGTITVDGVATDLYAPSATVIPPASGITYDNTTSGLQATDVQAAIDEVEGDVSSLQTDIASKSEVSYNQIVTSGTKIGEITIDGNTTDIYSSPTVTTIAADNVTFDPDLTPYASHNVQDALEELSYFLDFSQNVYMPNVCCSGYITATNKDIYFLIPYHKMCTRSISNEYPLRGNIYVRGVSGYILQNHALNGYSMRATTGTYCRVEQTTAGIFIRLHDDGGFSSTVTTNTPVNVYLNNLLLQRT